jgi:Damage-control phosphatase ARMT1-like domain
LSLWPAGQDKQPKHTDSQTSQSHIVINDTTDVIDYLAGQIDQSLRVDFIVDNAGFELVCDLALTDFLLSSTLASTVVLHLKCHPTFVSDATISDVEQTIDFLARDFQPDIKNFGQRLHAHLGTNRLQFQDDLFWTSPLSFWDMPDRIRQELARSNLLISKGDANYRRLLGDCHWPYTTPFADIVSYLPTPLVALRTFKSEVAAGLQPEQITILEADDPDWLTNGWRGVIQFAV